MYVTDHVPKKPAAVRDAPNVLKNLPIIPSRTSQNLSLLFFKIPLTYYSQILPLSKKVVAISS